MNIIEAIQQAENGKLIRHNFGRRSTSVLKYMDAGIFYEYEIVDGKAHYLYAVRDFPIAQILSTAWEIVPDTFFKS